MPEVMSKGPMLRKLDARYTNQTLETLQERLKTLKSLPPYPAGNIATYKPAGGSLSKSEIRHIRTHWFNDPHGDGSNDPQGPGYWKGDIQPIEPIIRQGLITAIDVAIHDPNTPEGTYRKTPLPIDFYWMCHPGHSPHAAGSQPGTGQYTVAAAGTGPGASEHAVEVTISWNDRQVTVIIHTPDPPAGDPLTGTESIYVVKRVPADHPEGLYEEILDDRQHGKVPKKEGSKIIRTHP
jgi:hypothetical protein